MVIIQSALGKRKSLVEMYRQGYFFIHFLKVRDKLFLDSREQICLALFSENHSHSIVPVGFGVKS